LTLTFFDGPADTLSAGLSFRLTTNHTDGRRKRKKNHEPHEPHERKRGREETHKDAKGAEEKGKDRSIASLW
jgi:hypothetical protein